MTQSNLHLVNKPCLDITKNTNLPGFQWGCSEQVAIPRPGLRPPPLSRGHPRHLHPHAAGLGVAAPEGRALPHPSKAGGWRDAEEGLCDPLQAPALGAAQARLLAGHQGGEWACSACGGLPRPRCVVRRRAHLPAAPPQHRGRHRLAHARASLPQGQAQAFREGDRWPEQDSRAKEGPEVQLPLPGRGGQDEGGGGQEDREHDRHQHGGLWISDIADIHWRGGFDTGNRITHLRLLDFILINSYFSTSRPWTSMTPPPLTRPSRPWPRSVRRRRRRTPPRTARRSGRSGGRRDWRALRRTRSRLRLSSRRCLSCQPPQQPQVEKWWKGLNQDSHNSM